LHVSFRPQTRPHEGACGTQGCVFRFVAFRVYCGNLRHLRINLPLLIAHNQKCCLCRRLLYSFKFSRGAIIYEAAEGRIGQSNFGG